MIAKDFGFPWGFVTEGNTGRIAEGRKAQGKSKDKRGRERPVRIAG